jgi:ribose transport system substrate-binding protein
MKKNFQLLALVLSTVMLSCSCTTTRQNEGEPLQEHINSAGGKENENQDNLDVLRPAAYSDVQDLRLEPGTYISIIGKYNDNSYWKQVEEGAERAIADINDMLEYESSDKIKLVFSAPGMRDDIDEQVSILDEELARYPNAICIAPVDVSACLTQFELADQDGIPIITFDSGSEYHDVTAHISTNNKEASATAAKELANMLGYSGDVAVFIHDSFSMTAIDREEGALNELAKHSGINVVQVYHMDELEVMAELIANERNVGLTEEDENWVKLEDITQEDVIAYILEQNQNLKGIYTSNLEATQLLAEVLKEQEREDLVFVGFDGGEKQLELLDEDVVDGLILQNPYGMGYATVVAAARTILDIGNEAFIDSGYAWLTKSNFEDPIIQKFIY